MGVESYPASPQGKRSVGLDPARPPLRRLPVVVLKV